MALAAAIGQLVAWAVLDARPPNDHDEYYTAQAIDLVLHAEASDLAGFLPRLRLHLLERGLHGQLPQFWMAGWLDLVGVSRFGFRSVNVPFLVALVVGTWLLFRGLAPARGAGLAALFVATSPLIVMHSRKWMQQFHAAALTPLIYAVMVSTVRDSRGSRWSPLVLGGLCGIRLHTHPVIWLDTLLVLGAASWELARVGRLGAILQMLGSIAILGAVPLGLVGGAPYSIRNYLVHKSASAPLELARVLDPEAVVGPWLASQWLAPSSLVIVVGLAILFRGAAVTRRRSSLRRWVLDRRVGVLMMVLVPQLPLVLLTVANEYFPEDWVHLYPALVALSFVGFSRVQFRPAAGRRCALAVCLLSLCQGFLPLLHPVSDLAEEAAAPWRFVTGPVRHRGMNNHHFPAPGPFADVEIANGIASAAKGPLRESALVGLLDLVSTPGQGDCSNGPPRMWRPGIPADIGQVHRDLARWPWVFAGFSGVETATNTGATGPRFWIARLWIDSETFAARGRCAATEIPEEILLTAISPVLSGYLGELANLRVVEDRAGRALFPVCDCPDNPAYTGRYLLVLAERATGVVFYPEPESAPAAP